MDLKSLYGLVLTVCMVGILVAVVVVLLDNLGSTTGLGATASEAINDTRDAITPITTTWLPIIVIIAILGILLGLVLMSFGMYGGGNR